jgi:gliding motility-associated-like protein
VTITDANGCNLVDSASLLAPTIFTMTASLSQYQCGLNISCNGSTDGNIKITPNGGCPPYQYFWSNGSIVDSIGNLTAGIYTVTVTDDNGNLIDSSFTLLEPNTLIALDSISSFEGGFGVSCHNSTDGYIAIQSSGGADCAPYVFSWNGPNGFTSANDTLFGLGAGIYTLDLQDVNGCLFRDSIQLTEPAPLVDTLTSPEFNGGYNISCNGASDGQINVGVSGGVGPYQFNWSAGPTNLLAGEYFVTITDQNGCAIQDSITLSEPNPLTSSLSSPTFNGGWNIRCNGGITGSIDLTPEGGTGPYAFLWSNGSTNEDLNLLTAGRYEVTITDANGCIRVDSITLTEPAPLTDFISTSSFVGGWQVSCLGENDGFIDLTVWGGTTPYGFLWSNFALSEDLTDVGSGLYIVGITDANGCILADTVTMTEPPVLSLEAVVTDASCNGQSSGAINTTPSGGTFPYHFSWSNGTQSEDLNAIPAGNYTLVLTDTNNCILTETWTLGEASAIELTGTVTNNTCFGYADGSISLGIQGGTLPYHINWSNGTNTPEIGSLVPGLYDVLVIDDAGCMDSAQFEVTEPAAVVAYAGADSNTCSQAIELWAASPAAGQSGTWTLLQGGGNIVDPSNPQALLNGLVVGGNVLTWTVAEGPCSDTDSVVIVLGNQTTCSPWPLEMPTGYTPNGDGQNDYFVVHGIDRYPDNVLVVFNRWGNKVYERINYQDQWNGDNSNGELLPDGTYFAILTINNGEIVLHGYVDMRR